LLAAAFRRPNPEGPVRVPLALYFLCLLACLGLGFFGGELVYGKRPAPLESPVAPPGIERGAALFQSNCAACHWTDSTETRVGPGLKGLANLSVLPTSKWPADDANLRRQIRTPFAGMPPFDQLSDEEVQALVGYLKTL
jgi:mono/diheme cytochrome c family protein